MKKISIILIFICFNHLFGNIGSSYQYGYSAKAFSLSNALVADNYNTFQTFSNPASLHECKCRNKVKDIFFKRIICLTIYSFMHLSI